MFLFVANDNLSFLCDKLNGFIGHLSGYQSHVKDASQGTKIPIETKDDKTKMIFVDRGNMSSSSSDEPSPDCVVCGNAMARLQVDESRATLNDLVEDMLKNKLSYGEEISILLGWI